MSPSPALLSARDLRRTAGGKVILDAAALDLDRGECLGIVGPSGGGKTTLLRAIVMLDPVDRGEVTFRGRSVSGDAVPRFRAAVSYLHQQPAIAASTVRSELELPFTLFCRRDRSFPEDLARQHLVTLGREPSFLDHPTADLSGGERQIVALVRALLAAPEVLLLDEPTAAMDRETATTASDLLRAWLGGGERACLLVSHDPTTLQSISTRTVQMAGGHLE